MLRGLAANFAQHVTPNGNDEPRGEMTQDKGAFVSPRRLHCLVSLHRPEIYSYSRKDVDDQQRRATGKHANFSDIHGQSILTIELGRFSYEERRNHTSPDGVVQRVSITPTDFS
jgi:hypothetical protein